jgi:hypothetical protein
MAGQNVTGVNIHTLPSAAYRLFTVHRSGKRWSATVAPEYYGLMMFTRAAPPGSRLLGLSASGHQSAIRMWATGGPGFATRVLLINESAHSTHTVSLRLAGRLPSRHATLQRLRAPGLTATGGVTLGGRAFASSTTTGTLAGPRHVGVAHSKSAYLVTLPPASAALLTAP